MIVMDGTMKHGQVVLDEPAPLPDGTRVKVVSMAVADTGEDDSPPTAEVIANRLALMDQLEPGWLSPEDDAAWRASLREPKEYEKARFFEDAERHR